MAEMIITSHQTVKPSSPTPLASKIQKLSFLDQIAPPVYIPLIFFYKNDQSNSMQHDEISRRLKQSLSEILTIFYPLAGTLNHKKLFVDCNDRGAQFVEARVHGRRLSQFLQNPKIEELEQLLAVDSSSFNDDNAAELFVKTSFFDCGGFSVGICFSHKIVDAASVVAFMNAWASTCRNGEASGIIHPSFDLALHFPPRDLPTLTSGSKEKNIVTKRFVFEREKVEKLRKDASSDRVKDPSRVEAVSAFIWRSFIEANKAKTTSLFAATHTVNMRPRAAFPPIPKHTFGNCFTGALSTIISPEEDDEGGSSNGLLVSKMRAAIRGVDDHYISNYTDSVNRLINEINDVSESGILITFSSWLRFPVYEVDFGWGKPVQVCTAAVPYKSILVFLMDTPSGDGVEAWINVPHQYEHFFELLQANCNNLT